MKFFWEGFSFAVLMSLATLQQLCEKLCAVLINLRKDGPNRKRSKLSGENKIKEVEELYGKFKLINNSLAKNSLSLKEQVDIESLIERIRRYRKEAIARIEGSIEDKPLTVEDQQEIEAASTPSKPQPQPRQQERVINSAIMANFDYNAAQKLPMLCIDSDVKRDENIRDFLNNAEFYNECLNESGSTMLVKFLLKCKVQGKALSEFGTPIVETFEQFKEEIKKRCGSKETIESLQIKLNNTRQGAKPMRVFVTEVEGLVKQMTNLEVETQNEAARPALKLANERRGLAFLKKGVNEKFKLILDCARHRNFNDAIQHLLELEPTREIETMRFARMQGQQSGRPYNNSNNSGHNYINRNNGSYNRDSNN